MQQAAPVALIAVAAGAALGAVEGLRKKLVRYRAALLIAVAVIPVTGLGVPVAHLLSQRVLPALFACVMLLVATRLRSTAYQMGAARFAAHRDLAGFAFAEADVDELLVHKLHSGQFARGT